MSDDQLAIYRTILQGWMGDAKQTIYLSLQTQAYASSFSDAPASCERGLKLEEVSPELIHLFRQADLSKLGLSRITLVDPRAQEREVADNDPGKAIRAGKSVDEAVRNGFAHGLVTLGEIRFDTSHTHAIVWYGFHCGRLCGNGGTLLLEKKDGLWKKKSTCSQWIS